MYTARQSGAWRVVSKEVGVESKSRASKGEILQGLETTVRTLAIVLSETGNPGKVVRTGLI